MPVMRFALYISLIFSLTASAQLPQSIQGWQAGDLQTISLPQLAAAVGDNEAVFHEYGFVGGERREYNRQNGSVVATLWLMEDATSSYGLFTFLLEEGMTRTRQEDSFTALSPGAFLYQHGPYVLEVRGTGFSERETSALVASLPESSGRESFLPPLPGYLPEEGLVGFSERFIIGPLAFSRAQSSIPAEKAGFGMGVEASFARYRLGDGTVQLILLIYPTPQIAAKMFEDFQSLPAIAGDTGKRTVFAERKSSLVAFVMDAPNLAATESLLNRIGYRADITWNEYVPPPGQNAGSLLLAVFSLAGFVLLIALFSGLAFGGVRVIAKRFVSKPVFDKPADLEIIKLDLSGK